MHPQALEQLEKLYHYSESVGFSWSAVVRIQLQRQHVLIVVTCF